MQWDIENFAYHFPLIYKKKTLRSSFRQVRYDIMRVISVVSGG